MNPQQINKIYCFSFELKTVFVLLFLLHNTYAIDLEHAKEQSCLPIKKTAQVDLQWMMSVKEWYYPVMSRLDLYLVTLELYGNTDDLKKLPESQLYYDGCINAEFAGNSAMTTGFNGKSTPFSFDAPTVNDEGVTSQRFTSESGLGVTGYITLTDNATYFYMAACWDNNQASWGVMSTVSSLPNETIKLIYEHAESLGFKKEYFEELRYTNCIDEEVNTIIAEENKTCFN